jgi:hypothetical protein
VVETAQLRRRLLHAGHTRGGEDLVDRVALVHVDRREQGVAAEQLLVFDVVVVDLGALGDVAVLARRELDSRDAEAQHDGEDQADGGDHARVASEVDGQPGPEALHHVGCSLHIVFRPSGVTAITDVICARQGGRTFA